MSELSWGKCTIKSAASTNGAPTGGWTTIGVPKEDSTKLNVTEGETKEAKEEGGGVVDRRQAKNTYVLEYDLFVKKPEGGQVVLPFDIHDGVVEGNFAHRVIPEDDNCVGIQIDNATIHVVEDYTSADGVLLHVKVMAQKPASGNTVKLAVNANGDLTVTPTALYFSSAADSTGKTITATSTGNVTASSDSAWATVTTSGKVATVKVTANSGTAPRTAIVAVTADNKTVNVPIIQIPA
ncbi:MAG: BACON domain-containing protein [Bacteroidales bacterium]|nr:BACON domain-containing protein [Bacteroidales bacterium]